MNMQPASTPSPSPIIASLLKQRSLPRIFTISWDNSKTRTRDPRRAHRQEAFGVCFPNGLVGLDNRQGFDDMAQLHHFFELRGSYDIIWHDEAEHEPDA